MCKKIQGKYASIECADPHESYFIATYNDKVVNGTGLVNSGWDSIDNGIISISYHLSNNVIVEIPPVFSKYLHLIEVSQSVIEGIKLYHYVYIHGVTPDNKVIKYQISLQNNDTENIGDVAISTTSFIRSSHWKKAKLCQ